MKEIRKDTYHRMTHVTGPGCVLVSLRVGVKPDTGACVTFRTARDVIVEPDFDIDKYVAEVMAGVREANNEFSGNLEIEEIEIVPDDFPREGQVKFCAYSIAKSIIEEST